jgi:transposase
MDNCAIHQSELLQELVESHGKSQTFIVNTSLLTYLSMFWEGCVVRFLPPYSPDFNPIEESFSCGELTM